MTITKFLIFYLGRSCNALWTFERFVDKELRTNVRDTIRDVTKTECEDLCLSENRQIKEIVPKNYRPNSSQKVLAIFEKLKENS